MVFLGFGDVVSIENGVPSACFGVLADPDLSVVFVEGFYEESPFHWVTSIRMTSSGSVRNSVGTPFHIVCIWVAYCRCVTPVSLP